MISSVKSLAYSGLHCQIIDIEADVSRHMPGFILVGLPDTAVQEARERIRSAIENSDLPFPRTKITVNLAPANVRKEGSLYDLAIALSILSAHNSITIPDTEHNACFIGELSLSGMVRSVSGVLLLVSYAAENHMKRIYVPEANAEEASYITGIDVYPVRSLRQIVDHFSGKDNILAVKKRSIDRKTLYDTVYDFSDIQGQEQAKRALEIAAAGGHNVLMNGVPGSGKTMLAKAFSSILPRLSPGEALEVSKIYSCSGLLSKNRPLITTRPYRSPHHTASVASIVGGGSWPKPGEITLAHRGVLFLDEFPEFPRNVLESLRQPLEDKIVSISRVSGNLEFPADFIFLAAQNPCPCGYWGDRERTCLCTAYRRHQYQRRISGPLLDRIDLHVRVNAVKRSALLHKKSGERSENISKRIQNARAIQRDRYQTETILNGTMSQYMIKKHCVLPNETEKVLMTASKKFQLSARSFYKIIKVSRTIADLSGHTSIVKEDVLEALQYRPMV